MMQRSESWRYKGSWTPSWNSAKKWDKPHYSRFHFLEEQKQNQHLLSVIFKKLLLCYCYSSTTKSVAKLVVFLSFLCVFTVGLKLVGNCGCQGHSLVDFSSALLFKSNPPLAVQTRPFQDCVRTSYTPKFCIHLERFYYRFFNEWMNTKTLCFMDSLMPHNTILENMNKW